MSTPTTVGAELIATLTKLIAESEARQIAHLDTRINEIIRAESTDIKTLVQTQAVETQARVAQLGVKLSDLSKSMEPGKRPSKTVKTAVEGAAADSTSTSTTSTAPVGEKPAANSMLHFKKMYVADETFRKHAIEEIKKFSPDCETKMAADAAIEKKKGDEKIKAQGTFMWNILREVSEKEGKVYFAEVGQHFKAAKDKYELANKPVQQVAEAHTPTK